MKNNVLKIQQVTELQSDTGIDRITRIEHRLSRLEELVPLTLIGTVLVLALQVCLIVRGF